MLIADVIVRATEQLQVAVAALEKNKDGRCSTPASRSSGSRRRATRCTTSGWAACSRASPDALQVIKWKEIYDNLEKTLDYIEDAGNVLESISIKHA